MVFLIYAAIHLICACIGYVGARRDWRREGLGWTRGDRRAFLLVALAFGPFMIPMVVFCEIKASWPWLSKDPDEEVSW